MAGDSVPWESHRFYILENPDTAKAIQAYTGHDHKLVSIMNFLRSNGIDDYVTMSNAFKHDITSAIAYVSNLQRAIIEAPRINTPVKLYRGLDIKLANVSDQFTDRSLLGTSLDIGVAASFAKKDCCLYELLIPKDTPMLYIESVTRTPGEQEVLLPFGCTFRIVSIRSQELIGAYTEPQLYTIYVCELLHYEPDITPLLSIDPHTLPLTPRVISKVIAAMRIAVQTYRTVIKFQSNVSLHRKILHDIISEKLKEIRKRYLNDILGYDTLLRVLLGELEYVSAGIISQDTLREVLSSLTISEGGAQRRRLYRKFTHRRNNRGKLP